MKERIKVIQKALGCTPDGIIGSQTLSAIEAKLAIPTATVSTVKHTSIPTQAQVRAGTSIYGKAGANLTTIILPFPLRLSWDLNTTVSKMTVNKAIAENVLSIYTETLQHYGLDKIKELRLDIFGGCYNDRNTTNGSTKSMHAWGIAIDTDPDKNTLKETKRTARLAKPEYEAFWEIVEKNGGVSLGREKDYDWMHWQFAKF